MKKIIIAMLLINTVVFAQDIRYRISESKNKQKNIEYSQGGVLVRFGHEKLQRFDFDKAYNFWRCQELWVAKNTRAKKVKSFIQAELLGINAISLNSIIGNYKAKVRIDTTASWMKKDIIRKLLELERRIEILEKP